MFVPSNGRDADTADVFSGCTVVVPAVGIGSVAQLAVDFLVQNIDGKCFGYLEHIGYVGGAFFDIFITISCEKQLSARNFP